MADKNVEVDLAYDADRYPEAETIVDDAIAECGGERVSSGMGGGLRDVQAEFKTDEAAEKFIRLLAEHLPTDYCDVVAQPQFDLDRVEKTVLRLDGIVSLVGGRNTDEDIADMWREYRGEFEHSADEDAYSDDMSVVEDFVIYVATLTGVSFADVDEEVAAKVAVNMKGGV